MIKDWTSILDRTLSGDSAYRALYDHHPDLILVLDRQGRYIDSNRMLNAGEAGRMNGLRLHPPGGTHFASALAGIASSFGLEVEAAEEHRDITREAGATVQYVPLHTEEGIAGVFAIFHDPVNRPASLLLESWIAMGTAAGGAGRTGEWTDGEIRSEEEGELPLAEFVFEMAEDKRLSLILNSVAAGIFGLDTLGRTIFINREGAQMLGYEPAELAGQPMMEMIHYIRGAPQAIPRWNARSC